MGKHVKDSKPTSDLYSGSAFDSDLFGSQIKSHNGQPLWTQTSPCHWGAKVGLLKCWCYTPLIRPRTSDDCMYGQHARWKHYDLSCLSRWNAALQGVRGDNTRPPCRVSHSSATWSAELQGGAGRLRAIVGIHSWIMHRMHGARKEQSGQKQEFFYYSYFGVDGLKCLIVLKVFGGCF